VAALTDAAMRGELALDAVYGKRLEIVRPTRRAVADLGRTYIETLVPDAREVVAALLAEGVTVRIVSGGLLPAVRALAGELGLGPGDVAAVDIRFDDAGDYAGFDAASPLAGSGGKRIVLAAWRAVLPGPIMLVGDGATDLEARPEVDSFVAFAGVACRANVIAAADAVVYGRSLAPVLALALGRHVPRDAAVRDVYERGRIALGEAASPTIQEAD
jgi:phosphoserine phosphatase